MLFRSVEEGFVDVVDVDGVVEHHDVARGRSRILGDDLEELVGDRISVRVVLLGDGDEEPGAGEFVGE